MIFAHQGSFFSLPVLLHPFSLNNPWPTSGSWTTGSRRPSSSPQLLQLTTVMFQPSARKRAERTAQDAAMVAREGGQKTQWHPPQVGTYGQRKRAQRVAVAGKNPLPRARVVLIRESAWVKNSPKSLRSPQWWRNPREVCGWRASRLQRYLLIGPKPLLRVPANQALKKNPNPLRGLPPPLSPQLQINARPRHPRRLHSRSLASLSTRSLRRPTPRGTTASRPRHRRPSTQRASGRLCVFFLRWKRKSCCLH